MPFTESTTTPAVEAQERADAAAVAAELAYRERHLAGWTISLTAVVGLAALAAAGFHGWRMHRRSAP